MPWLRIAFRNVFRQRKRVVLLGGAIAFGFFVVTLVGGFSGGLLVSVERNLAALLGGHLYVTGSEVGEGGRELAVLSDSETLDEALRAIAGDIISVNARSSAGVALIFGSSEETLFVSGIVAAEEQAVLEALRFTGGDVQSFLDQEAGIIVPQETLERLRLEVGEQVIVRASTVTGQQNVAEFVIVGTTEGSTDFGITSGYAHREALNRLLALAPGQYQQLNIFVRDVAALEATTLSLHGELERLGQVAPREEGESGFTFGGPEIVDEDARWEGTRFSVGNINDFLGEISALVSIMNRIALAVFVVILVIIMVGVTNAYRLVMLERTAEIGSMRAMGAQRANIRSIFFWEAGFVALAGVVVGLAAALVVIGGMSFIALPSSPFDFFLDDNRLRFTLAATPLLTNALLITAMTLLAVSLPAQAAARLEPAEALR